MHRQLQTRSYYYNQYNTWYHWHRDCPRNFFPGPGWGKSETPPYRLRACKECKTRDPQGTEKTPG